MRSTGRGSVEVDRDTQRAYRLPRRPRQPGRIFEGSLRERRTERHEREYVQSTHPGVYAALRVQVYLGGAGPREDDGSPEERLLFSSKGQDAAIVVRIRVEVQDAYAGYGADGVSYA